LAGTSKGKKAVGRNRLKWEAITETELSGSRQGPEAGSYENGKEISEPKIKVKVKCTLVQALRLCTGRTAHRGSRGIALLFHDQRH